MVVYVCEDSLEGVFTAIYNAYEDKQKPEDTVISLTEEFLLFAEYRQVITDVMKTLKVIRTLKRQFGEENYLDLCRALSSPDTEKAQAVYRTVAWGLSAKPARGHLLDHLTDDYVNKVFKLSKNAGREQCHLSGFLRFEELENKVLYAKIGPKNNLLTFLMPHFADRFPMENFLIYDDGRGIFGVHPAGGQWYLLQGEELYATVEKLDLSEEEKKYRALFCGFCKTIAIKERENKALQQNMLPLRFQEYMVEFNA